MPPKLLGDNCSVVRKSKDFIETSSGDDDHDDAGNTEENTGIPGQERKRLAFIRYRKRQNCHKRHIDRNYNCDHCCDKVRNKPLGVAPRDILMSKKIHS